MRLKTSVVRCKEYNAKDISKALDQALNLIGGLNKFVKKGDKVLLKVNMLAAHPPEKAVTTHPMVVEQVIKKVKALGAYPSVGDSPALASVTDVGEVSGIKAACDRHKVPLISLSGPKWVKNPQGKLVKRFPLASELDDFDLTINMPKLKTHVFTVYTGAVKNLFGCIPGRMKGSFHRNYPTRQAFNGMLLDLYRLVRPKLTIMDAVVCMQGLGPSMGSPRYGGYLLASNDALALDYVAAGIVGLRDKVHLFTDADMRTLEVMGEKTARIEHFKAPRVPSVVSTVRSRLMELLARWLVMRPVVDKNCVGCGDCARACPKHAISLKKVAYINPSKCIKCFCCYEVCPHHAIVLKRFF